MSSEIGLLSWSSPMLSTTSASKLVPAVAALSLAFAILAFAPGTAFGEAARDESGAKVGNWAGAPPAKRKIKNRFVDVGSRIRIIERAGDQQSCETALFIPARPGRCQSEIPASQMALGASRDLESPPSVQKTVAPDLTTEPETAKNAPPLASTARLAVQEPESMKLKSVVNPQPAEPEVAKADPAPSSSILSCDKVGAIVSDFGFTGVRSSDCDGEVYAFNASRDGKPFMITLNSVNGELIKVQKLSSSASQ